MCIHHRWQSASHATRQAQRLLLPVAHHFCLPDDVCRIIVDMHCAAPLEKIKQAEYRLLSSSIDRLHVTYSGLLRRGGPDPAVAKVIADMELRFVAIFGASQFLHKYESLDVLVLSKLLHLACLKYISWATVQDICDMVFSGVRLSEVVRDGQPCCKSVRTRLRALFF